jgi:hypothetical protein
MPERISLFPKKGAYNTEFTKEQATWIKPLYKTVLGARYDGRTSFHIIICYHMKFSSLLQTIISHYTLVALHHYESTSNYMKRIKLD